jgi:phenylacetate-coenzyme A ligase PaaK-like adenylate-forming protein
LGDRCDYLSELAPRFFHPLTQNFFYEVINENELVVTSLRPFEYPFVFRYKTGNSVIISDYKCKCGNNKLMEVFGKLETDVIRLQGAFIYASEIYNALSPYSKHLLSFDFRLHVYEVIKKDKIMPKLVLQLVPKIRIKDPKKLKDEIEKGISENLFVTTNATLSKLVEREIFMPLEVEFTEMFPFSQKQQLIISHLV